MKFLVFIILTVIWMSLTACSNKKTEKCSYNNVDMPCDEYRRLGLNKPNDLTKSSDVERVQQEDLEVKVESAKANNPDCAAKADELYKSSKVTALCNSPNEKTQKCIENAKALKLDAEAVLKICKDAPEQEAP